MPRSANASEFQVYVVQRQRTRDEDYRRGGLCTGRGTLYRFPNEDVTPFLFRFGPLREIEAALRPALAHIEARGVLAYPTENRVWSLGGGIDRDSVDALVALKTRPPAKPFLLLIAGAGMIDRLDLRLPSYAANLVARHWPGPLTLVLAGGERRVPDRLRGPEGGVAVRWTSHPGITRLVYAHGDAITSTSANRPGVPPATSAAEILSQWGDAVAHAAKLRVLDGGH